MANTETKKQTKNNKALPPAKEQQLKMIPLRIWFRELKKTEEFSRYIVMESLEDTPFLWAFLFLDRKIISSEANPRTVKKRQPTCKNKW